MQGVSLEQKSAGGIGAMMDKFRPLLTPEVMHKTNIVFALNFGEGENWTFDMKNKGFGLIYFFL